MNLDDLRQRPTITVRELATGVLHCGLNQAYAAVREGLVPSIRVGSTGIRIPVPALLRVLGGECGNEDGGGERSRPPPAA